MVVNQSRPHGHDDMLFHICRSNDWDAAVHTKKYQGTERDRRDGFIHFSTAEQLPDTAARHFAKAADLIVLAVRHASLEPRLKWESAPYGTPFPHHYGAVESDWVVAVYPMELDPDGVHVLGFLDSKPSGKGQD